MKSETARRGKAASVVSFLGLFGLYVFLGHLLLSSAWGTRLLVNPWTHGNVRCAAAVSSVVGLDARASGRDLQAGQTGLDVNKGCDGTSAALIVGGAILAFPATWRSRGLGVALGIMAVFAVNAIRIASLLLVAVRWPARLDFFHVDIWQPLMMLIAFGLFLGWGVWLAGSSAVARSAPAAEQ